MTAREKPDIGLVLRAMGISISGELEMPTCMQVIDERVRPLGIGLFGMSSLLTVRHAKRPVSFETADIGVRSRRRMAQANGMACETAI